MRMLAGNRRVLRVESLEDRCLLSVAPVLNDMASAMAVEVGTASDLLGSGLVIASGRVFHDLDRDGRYDGGEPGLPGHVIVDKRDQTLTGKSGPDGYYEISAEYFVEDLTLEPLDHYSVPYQSTAGTVFEPSFATYATSSVSTANPVAVAAADFDGDLDADLAVANFLANTVTLLWNQGDGTFANAVSYTVGQGPRSIAAGDMTGDGWPDIVVANDVDDSIVMLSNDQDGTFTAASPDPTGSGPSSVVVEDLNDDDLLDVAVAAFDSARVWVLFNQGGGNLGTPIDLTVGPGPSGVSVGDMNEDSNPDLVVSHQDGLSVLLNNGDNTFASEARYANSYGTSLAIGDCDNDGHLDVVFGTSGDRVYLYWGLGDGSLEPGDLEVVPAGVHHCGVACADLDGDGDLDIVRSGLQSTLDNPSLTVTQFGQVLYRDGRQFNDDLDSSAVIPPSSLLGSVLVHDLNADGWPDVVLAGRSDNLIEVGIHSGSNVPYSTPPLQSEYLSCGETATNLDFGIAYPGGITVSPTTGLQISESGGSAQFTVQLDTQPSADVIIGLSSNDANEGTVWPLSLTFDSNNWNSPQNVTVTAVDDAVDDGDRTFMIVTAPAVSADVKYNARNAPDVDIVNIDNDTAAITFNPTSGLTTTEAGSQRTFTVRLDTKPTDNVTIGLSSSDPSEGTVSPISLTFTPTNWNAPQTVTVTGVNDDVDDDDVSYSVVTAAAVSVDTKYNGLNAADVTVTNTDDDTAGIAITPTSGLITTEVGGQATFTVRLDSEPTDNVTIALSSSDPSEGTVSPVSLTFTPTNWNASQTVTVTGVNDDVDDDDVSYRVVTAAAVSVDTKYNGLNAADVTVTATDDDTAGITVSPTAGLTTTEAAGQRTFTLRLETEPTADVAIAISSSDPSEGTPSPASLTFTPDNWNSPQTVTVTGANDYVDDGDVAYTIVTAPATSADLNYNDLNPADVSVTNQDDDTAGVVVISDYGLITTEAGGVDYIRVKLTSEPIGPVMVLFSSNDISEATVQAEYTLTPTNWSTGILAKVTGVDDSVDDGDVPYTIVTHSFVSTDPKYNGLNPDDVSGTNQDDDTAGITVSQIFGLVTTEMSGTATFTVRLDTEPTANVTIDLSSSDMSEGTVSPASLSFTSGNWNTPQTVTVRGVDDYVDDGDIAYTIASAAATSADPKYNGLNPTDVAVTNLDDDTVGITVAPVSGLETTEWGGTARFTIRLDTEPTADVTIDLSSSDPSEGTVSLSLTFTSSNWHIPQTVTIMGVDDNVDDGDVAYVIVTAPAISADPKYNGLDPPDIPVTDRDDDTAGITVTPISGLTTTEAGGSTQFTVQLESQPTANVTISLSSSDTSEGTISPSSLSFTPGNWSMPQTATVTGVNDDIDDGDVAYMIVTAPATSSDTKYNGLVAPNVSVVNTDDENDDFGDAPSPYPTLLTAGGARHFAAGPTMGSYRDAESDGQPNTTADGDDTNGTPNDEDGIIGYSGFAPGMIGAWVDVVASDPSFINAWLDVNANGIWEASEQIATDLPLVAGTNHVTFDIPIIAVPGPTYARLRLTSYNTGGTLLPTGLADDGEVEDYVLEIENDLYFQGTTGSDTFILQPGIAGTSMHRVTINGALTTYDPAVYTTINIDALGGNDTISVIATTGSETATLNASSVNLLGPAYEVNAANVETIYVYGSAGDTANLSGDVAGNNTFKGRPTYSELEGPTSYHYVSGFDAVTATPGGGSNNRALLYGSAGADVLTASASAAAIDWDGVPSATATGFNEVLAFGAAGDSASLTGNGAGGNTLYGRPAYTELKSPAFYLYAGGFDTVTATPGGGTNNRALLYGGTGADIFTATPTSAVMDLAGAPIITATGFNMALGFGGSGDTANLTGDSAGDNFLQSRIAYTNMSGASYYYFASGFQTVTAASGSGTNNRAFFYNDPAASSLTADPTTATMDWNGTASATVSNFDRVFGFGSTGDTATFTGNSGGNNTFEGRSDYNALTGTGYYHYANGFDSVSATAGGGTNNRVFLYGGAGADTLSAAPTTGTMTWNSGRVAQMSGFDKVFGYGSIGDTANLTGDATATNTFDGYPTYSTLYSAAFYHYLSGFDLVTATAGSATSDRANLYDSVLDDLFISSPGGGQMDYGDDASTDISVLAFERIHTRFLNGGNDDADLTDSSSVDQFTGSGANGQLTDAAAYWLYLYFDSLGADRVTLNSSDTGNTVNASSLDYLLQYDPTYWTEI